MNNDQAVKPKGYFPRPNASVPNLPKRMKPTFSPKSLPGSSIMVNHRALCKGRCQSRRELDIPYVVIKGAWARNDCKSRGMAWHDDGRRGSKNKHIQYPRPQCRHLS